jgi:hypothetical protein
MFGYITKNTDINTLTTEQIKLLYIENNDFIIINYKKFILFLLILILLYILFIYLLIYFNMSS